MRKKSLIIDLRILVQGMSILFQILDHLEKIYIKLELQEDLNLRKE